MTMASTSTPPTAPAFDPMELLSALGNLMLLAVKELTTTLQTTTATEEARQLATRLLQRVNVPRLVALLGGGTLPAGGAGPQRMALPALMAQAQQHLQQSKAAKQCKKQKAPVHPMYR